MRRAKRDGTRPEIRKVRERIERWRETRTKISPMPEKLWAAATALGRTHGAYRISQDLGINYESLRARLERSTGVSPSRGRRRRRAHAVRNDRARFVELEAMPAAVAALGPDGALIEVLDVGGSKLTIRLGIASTVDVCSVLAAFRDDNRCRGRRPRQR